MRKYEKYKDSGVEWIGKVPEHWEYLPLKRYGKMNKGVTFTKSDLVDIGNPVISYGQIHSKLNNGIHVSSNLIKYIPDNFIINENKAQVHFGDFIFADTSEDLEGCGNCVYIDSDISLYAGYHSIILKTNGKDSKYFAYLFKTDIWRNQIRSMVSGVKVYSITQSILSFCSIIVPSLSEQKSIASYLDSKVGEIDNMIEKTEKKIELYEELKKSIITHAVTKGLNPNAKMKNSGVDWIGEIPEHWNKCKLKNYLVGLQDGTHGSYERVPSKYPLLSAKNVFEYGLKISENESTISKYDNDSIIAKGYPQKGDIVLCCVGTIGRCCIYKLDKRYAFQRSVSFLRCNPKSNNCFLLYLLKSQVCLPQYDIYAKTSAQSGIYKEALANFEIIKPPLPEQQVIASYLDSKTSAIDSQISIAHKRIDLLKELKSSLITNVVTGKIKVAPLSDAEYKAQMGD